MTEIIIEALTDKKRVDIAESKVRIFCKSQLQMGREISVAQGISELMKSDQAFGPYYMEHIAKGNGVRHERQVLLPTLESICHRRDSSIRVYLLSQSGAKSERINITTGGISCGVNDNLLSYTKAIDALIVT